MSKKSMATSFEMERNLRRDYADPEDFCSIFQEEDEMDRLFFLALLLTGDEEAAEKCFLAALENCHNGSNVFREWARSWSRRAIVLEAIRRVNPRAENAETVREFVGRREPRERVLRSLLQLPAFDRFVFAMTVLERYADKECALLLGCHPLEVEQARNRALRSLASTSRFVSTAPSTDTHEEEAALLANAG